MAGRPTFGTRKGDRTQKWTKARTETTPEEIVSQLKDLQITESKGKEVTGSTAPELSQFYHALGQTTGENVEYMQKVTDYIRATQSLMMAIMQPAKEQVSSDSKEQVSSESTRTPPALPEETLPPPPPAQFTMPSPVVSSTNSQHPMLSLDEIPLPTAPLDPMPTAAAGFPPITPAAAGFTPITPAAAGFTPITPAAAGFTPITPAAAGFTPISPTAAGFIPNPPTPFIPSAAAETTPEPVTPNAPAVTLYPQVPQAPELPQSRSRAPQAAPRRTVQPTAAQPSPIRPTQPMRGRQQPRAWRNRWEDEQEDQQGQVGCFRSHERGRMHPYRARGARRPYRQSTEWMEEEWRQPRQAAYPSDTESTSTIKSGRRRPAMNMRQEPIHKAISTLVVSVGKFDSSLKMDGTCKTKAKQWIRTFEEAVNLHCGSPPAELSQSKLRSLLFQLVDANAQLFLDTLPVDLPWERMKEKFLAKFGVSVFQAKAQLERCRQARDERVASFFERIDSIAAQADLNVDFLADAVRTKLSYLYQDQLAAAEASAKLVGRQHQFTYTEMRSFLVEWERARAIEVRDSRRFDHEGKGDGAKHEAREKQQDGRERQNSRDQQRERNLPRPGTPRPEANINVIQEEPAAGEGDACNFIQEKASVIGPEYPNLSQCAAVQHALLQGGVNVQELKEDVDLYITALQELLPTIATEIAERNPQGACDFANQVYTALTATEDYFPAQIEQDNIRRTAKLMADGQTKESVKRLRGNSAKEMIRQLKTSIPVTKLVSADPRTREYLLYTILTIASNLQDMIYFPQGTRHQELSADDWKKYGSELAGRSVAQFDLSPTVWSTLRDMAPNEQNVKPTSRGAAPSRSAQHQEPQKTWDTDMKQIPIQGVQHLQEICNKVAGGRTRVRTEVTGLTTDFSKALSNSVDKRHLTRRAHSEYHDCILDGQRIWAMWDTGSSFSLITLPLAHELGLRWQPLENQFQVISGDRLRTVGVVSTVKLRLHPMLELHLAQLRVVESTDMSFILGQDLIGTDLNGVWRRKGTNTDGGKAAVQYEAGPEGAGTWYSIPLYNATDEAPVHSVSLVDGTLDEPTLTVMATLAETSYEDPAKVMASPEQWEALSSWLKNACDADPIPTLQAFLDAKKQGLQVIPIECEQCGRPHVDKGKHAQFEHQSHLCLQCGREIRHAYGSVGNPIAAVHPVLEKGKLWISELTTKPRIFQEAERPFKRWRGQTTG